SPAKRFTFAIKIDGLTFITDLKERIWSKKRNALANVNVSQLRLWRVNIPVNDENKMNMLDTSRTNINVKEELDGIEMCPVDPISKYFDEQYTGPSVENTCINIIVDINNKGPVNWNNNKSIFTWLQNLKRSNGIIKQKLVDTYGAKFPLQGRDETIENLFRGTFVTNGICDRFKQRNTTDRNNHPIPILVNGPGAGKSRFLQELPTLLCNHVQKYTEDNSLINSIKNRMFSINVTYGNDTAASEEDVRIGETSVALRMLYEHFIVGGSYDYKTFIREWGKSQLSISTALDIILMDVDADKNDDYKTNFIIIGIDELNILHNLYRKDSNSHNPVQLIVYAVNSGTIQGPLEEMARGSTYLHLYLPLRLLRDEEVWNISKNIADTENLAEYINRSIFRRCIGDLGGQVRALEIFYIELLKQVECQTNYIDYIHIMLNVKDELIQRYPFKRFANMITPAIIRAILNIPVRSYENASNNGQLTYTDLSSHGILNLEPTRDGFYKVMIDQNPHVYWQEFEDFNMRFWTLRLRLLSFLNEPITIQELFRGAFNFGYYSECIFHLPTVDSIQYQQLNFQYPTTEQNLRISPGIVYKNGAGAPWDLFFVLDDCIFTIQIKSSEVIDERMLNTEYNKVKNAFNILQNSFEGEFVIKNWVLLICTNGSRTVNSLNSLQKNCFIVDCENFKDFYGYTFSSRAAFSAANDTIDVNTAEVYELKTITGIGEETAKDIYNKRPYCDENDLYSK
ncbi:16022_t:CDS:2, partial [Racocetra persica]